MVTGRTFEDLLAEGDAVPVAGWDFSWFEGRATEERPSWGYARMLVRRIAAAGALLDVQTGGGEVLAEALARATRLPGVVVATESWQPNVEIARRQLERFGVTVVATDDEDDLPLDAEAFDLVVSRHPVVVRWDEIARVLRPGGTYFSQQVGAGSNRELTDFVMGPQPVADVRSPQGAADGARSAGLTVVDLRQEALRTVFDDVGAVVYFLRKVLWTVPGFSVGRYRHRLAALHDQIERDGPFVAHSQRFLIEVTKPA